MPRELSIPSNLPGNIAAKQITNGQGLTVPQVGAACACMLSKRGFKVDLLELREDLRQLQASELSVGRSINLALSVRGQETLRFLGLEEEIIKNHAIPMYARMIHNLDGTTNPIPYGKKGQCIYSVGRR